MKRIILGILLALMFVPAFAEMKVYQATEKRKKAIQGTYYIHPTGIGSATEEIREFPKYVISGMTITEYRWDSRKRTWVKEYTAPFTLKYRKNASYMTGYNIVYKDNYGYTNYLCSGDTDGDGKMDLWSSDSFYYTKQ